MPNSKEVDDALKKNFLSKEKFVEDIELTVNKQNISYIDAIVEYCERNDIEIESVKSLISKPLKEKIRYEATELNYLKKTSRAKLPL